MSWDILNESFENATNFDVAGWSTSVGNGTVNPNSNNHAFSGHGNECLQLTQAGANFAARISRTIANEAAVTYGEMHVFILSENLADGNECTLLTGFDANWAESPTIALRQVSGALEFRSQIILDSSYRYGTYANVQANTEYALRWKLDASAKAFQFWVDGNSVYANNFTTGPSGLKYLYVGGAHGASANSTDICIDGLQISSTGFVEAGNNYTLEVDAGAYAATGAAATLNYSGPIGTADLIDEDFEATGDPGYDMANWVEQVSAGCTLNENYTTNPYRGNQCMQSLKPTGGAGVTQADIFRVFANDEPETWGAFYFKLVSMSDGGDFEVLVAQASDNDETHVLKARRVGSDYSLYWWLWNNDTFQTHNSTDPLTISLGEWYKVSFAYGVNSQAAQWKINDNLQENIALTGNLTAGTYRTYVGLVGANTMSAEAHYDYVRMSSAGWPANNTAFDPTQYVRLRWTK